jgi:hypothetical protein
MKEELHEQEVFPISKFSKETGWIFVKEVTGSYEEALKVAGELQKKDENFQYRIWDNR